MPHPLRLVHGLPPDNIQGVVQEMGVDLHEQRIQAGVGPAYGDLLPFDFGQIHLVDQLVRLVRHLIEPVSQYGDLIVTGVFIPRRAEGF